MSPAALSNLPDFVAVHRVRSWPNASVAAMQRFGRDRRHSGHRADIVNRSKMTHNAVKHPNSPLVLRQPSLFVGLPPSTSACHQPVR